MAKEGLLKQGIVNSHSHGQEELQSLDQLLHSLKTHDLVVGEGVLVAAWAWGASDPELDVTVVHRAGPPGGADQALVAVAEMDLDAELGWAHPVGSGELCDGAEAVSGVVEGDGQMGQRQVVAEAVHVKPQNPKMSI